ncbi:DUF922 domain-containing protein [Cesiribacter andamanensis]|uniref:Putative secreted Zn-dependent protease n=1 Tax=Cesiribacter andamanensis AMV16 TaxID=1279009 RepID=M7NQZ4_9BACT|nr:DUF922 domain-containing protein [Cesiribacter andamanensis]EMR00924.1 putative secreted Zn-dependent protease [Cesiribacter andamanensis AMV16]
MQHLKTSIAVLLMLILMAGAGSAQAQGMLVWSAQLPLRWSDFTGAPQSGDEAYAAATYAGLEMSIADVAFSGHVTYRVKAVFDSKRSWAHPHRMDEYVLAHEQLHFDIAEAYARRLEHKLNSMRLKVKDKEVAKKLLYRYNQVQQEDQQRYDTECVHGLNREKQAEWRQRFDRELRITRPAASIAQAK